MKKKDNEKDIALDLHPGSNEDIFTSPEKLYVLAEHWQSDIKFFQDELIFLNTLLDKYLLKLVEEENVSKIAPLTLALTKLEVNTHVLSENVTKHMQHIQKIMENDLSLNSQIFIDEHQTLESELGDFVKNFRTTKKEIFDSTEQVLKSEKAKHLLTP